MTNDFNCPEDHKYTQLPAQLELLEALLEPEDACYPWNPTDPESEAYFADRSGEFLLQDWSEEEIATQAQTFFNQLEQIWCATTPTDDDPAVALSNPIQAALQQRFATYIPQDWLNWIAHHANRVFSTQSMADQLVQCVQDLLPNWVEEDLLVLARPFAYAMRGTQTKTIEFVLDNFRNRGWIELSEIEQARVSLAIAQYALIQLRRDNPPSPS